MNLDLDNLPAAQPAALPAPSLRDRLNTAAEALEAVAADSALLAGMSDQERLRLIRAAGDVYCPGVGDRRRPTDW